MSHNTGLGLLGLSGLSHSFRKHVSGVLSAFSGREEGSIKPPLPREGLDGVLVRPHPGGPALSALAAPPGHGPSAGLFLYDIADVPTQLADNSVISVAWVFGAALVGRDATGQRHVAAKATGRAGTGRILAHAK
eukprot:g63901.t1